MVKLKEDFRPADAGFTLKQGIGSARPATIALGLFLLLQVVVAQLWVDGEYEAEDLFFQALMPGLDEEPMFRGVLLYLLSLAIRSKQISIFGARMNAAGLMLVVLFGLVHGLGYKNGEWAFSAISIAYTGLAGFFLLWLRERTGSLVFPIVAHNAVNFIGQFKFV